MAAESISRAHVEGAQQGSQRLVFVPLIHRMGPTITIRLERSGFAPRGGGIMGATIHPAKKLEPLNIRERGEILHQGAEVQLSHLPRHIADRELAIISPGLDFSQEPPVYKNISPG
jgi:RNA 3'-terminal phosphate cyclase (ATP)